MGKKNNTIAPEPPASVTSTNADSDESQHNQLKPKQGGGSNGNSAEHKKLSQLIPKPSPMLTSNELKISRNHSFLTTTTTPQNAKSQIVQPPAYGSYQQAKFDNTF